MVCPLPNMSRDGSRMVQTLIICLLERRSVLPNPPSNRKDDVKSSRHKAATSRARDVSSLRKKPRLFSIVAKSSSKKVSIAKKTPVGTVPLSSARVKHLVGAESKKVELCEMFGTFRSSLLPTSSEIVICPVKRSAPEPVHLLKGKEMLTFLSV